MKYFLKHMGLICITLAIVSIGYDSIVITKLRSRYTAPLIQQRGKKHKQLEGGCSERNQGAACVGACSLRYCETMKYNPGSPIWVTDLWMWMLLTCQNTAQQFLILRDRILREVKSRNMALKLQSNLAGMCVCTYMIGHSSVAEKV